MLRPLKIGSLEIAPSLILAPMSGVTNIAFRRLIKQENPEAVGLVVTEFISVEGMTRRNEQSLRMMRFSAEERPVSIQIFGHTIERMVMAAQMVEEAGADIIDINCGCPVPKVVKKGGGCELMRQPEHLEKMLVAVKKAVNIPLTIKIRSGWSDGQRNALEIAKIAEGSGVSMLAIHGRTRQALYRGDADWGVVAEVARALSIPVVGSGDVLCSSSARRALESGVAGLMIGRGAMSNPWIFTQLHRALRGEEYEVPPELETVAVLERYLNLLLEEMPERAVLGKMKQLASQVTRRVRGSTPVRRALCTSGSIEELRQLLQQWREFLIARAHGGAETDPFMDDAEAGSLAA